MLWGRALQHVQRSWGSTTPGVLGQQQGAEECAKGRELQEVRTKRKRDLVGHSEESGR